MPYLLILITLFSGWAWAGQPEVLKFGKVPATSVEILDQPGRDVIGHLEGIDQLPWRPATGGLFSTSGEERWLRFDFRVTADLLQPMVVSINNASNKLATLYLVHNHKILQSTVFGSQVPISEREIPTPNPVIPLRVEGAGDYTVLIVSRDILLQRMLADLSLVPERQLGFLDLTHRAAMGTGMLGTLFVFFLFLLALLLWRFRIEYAYAGVLMFSASWTILLREGLLYPVLGWYGPWWDENAVIAALSGTLGSVVLYLRERLKPLRSWLDGYIRLSGWLLYLLALGALFMDFFRAVDLSGMLYFNALVVLWVLVAVAWRRALAEGWQRRVFAVAWTVFAVLTCARFARIPFPDFPLGTLSQWNFGFLILAAWIVFEYLKEEAQDELQRRHMETAAASRIEMVNRLSHEIRTPLNAVIGLADLLRTQRDPVITRNYAGMIRSAGQTLLHLVNDILDFSKFGDRQSPLAREPFRLDRVLSDVMTSVLPQVTETGIVPKIVISADLPYYLLGDALRVKQIFSNLIGNAIKFSPLGGEVDITIGKGEAVDGRVQLLCEVSDAGRGIPKDQLEAVFEPYVQTKASDHSRLQGTGLGLAITRLLVQNMGGSIRADSDEGRGATFYFDLWLEVDPAAPDVQSLFAPLSGKRVALVSGLTSLAEQLDHILSYYGAAVRTYTSLEEFLGAAEVCDLVLTDSHQTLTESCLGLLVEGGLSAQPVVVLEPEPKCWLNGVSLSHFTRIHLPQPFLSITAAIITAMSGRTVVLPEEEGSDAAHTRDNEAHRLLVVDDNALNLMVCGKLLESLDVPYTTVQGGREALDIMQAEHFTLLLLDCEMPDVDGFQVALVTREREREHGAGPIPIVALTAHALDDVRERCFASGMDEVMHKPISRQELAAVISRYPVRSSFNR